MTNSPTTLWDKHGDLLAKQGIKEKGLEDRLADWLAYLAFVCLVSIQEEGILLNPSQIQASLLENETEVPQELFTQLLLEGISDLKGRALGSTYIPIPDIRRYVMNHLLNRNLPITEIQFDEMLRKQPRTTNEYIILLSPPGRRVDGGIHIEPNYYYYISLHRMEA